MQTEKAMPLISKLVRQRFFFEFLIARENIGSISSLSPGQTSEGPRQLRNHILLDILGIRLGRLNDDFA